MTDRLQGSHAMLTALAAAAAASRSRSRSAGRPGSEDPVYYNKPYQWLLLA